MLNAQFGSARNRFKRHCHDHFSGKIWIVELILVNKKFIGFDCLLRRRQAWQANGEMWPLAENSGRLEILVTLSIPKQKNPNISVEVFGAEAPQAECF